MPPAVEQGPLGNPSRVRGLSPVSARRKPSDLAGIVVLLIVLAVPLFATVPVGGLPTPSPSVGIEPGPSDARTPSLAVDATGFMHVVRSDNVSGERGVHYTLKSSPAGSHMQIVAAIRPESRVLDLGCSQGLLARPLREKGVRVTGVDALAPAGTAAELAAYHRRDLELPLELPFGRVFDYAIVADVIEHLRNRQQLLRGTRRYLKEDGRLLVSTPNVALWFYRLSLLVGRFEYGPRGVLDRTHVHLYTRATIRREVERAGFHVLRKRATALPFEVVFESTGRSRLVRALEHAYWGLARLWPELFAYQIVLEAEITMLDDQATTSA